jgi:hypothetical protein
MLARGGGGGSPTDHPGNVVYTNYIKPDTAKRKSLSTRQWGIFERRRRGGQGPLTRFRALTLFAKQIHILFFVMDERERRRASEDALAEKSGLLIIFTGANMILLQK